MGDSFRSPEQFEASCRQRRLAGLVLVVSAVLILSALVSLVPSL